MRYYAKKVRQYKPGETIFTEDSECDGMYIIDKGKVRVYKTVSVGGKKKELELCQLGPKAMFGEMAMIDESKRSASVMALELTECTIITRQIFEDQLAEVPPWLVSLIRILVGRLRETNDKLRRHIEEHTSRTIDDMTGVFILSEGEKAGMKISESGILLQRAIKGTVVKPDDIVEDLFRGS